MKAVSPLSRNTSVEVVIICCHDFISFSTENSINVLAYSKTVNITSTECPCQAGSKGTLYDTQDSPNIMQQKKHAQLSPNPLR